MKIAPLLLVAASLYAQPVYITPTSHLDFYWGGTREECLARGNQIIAQVIRLARQSPQFRFLIEDENFVANFVESFESFVYSQDFVQLQFVAQFKSLVVYPDDCSHSRPLGRLTCPRVIHQDSPHKLRGYAQKMCAVFPIRVILLHQAQIDFVNEGRGLDSMSCTLRPKIVIGNCSQIPINQRDEPAQSIFVPELQLVKQQGYFAGRIVHRLPSDTDSLQD